MDDYFDNLDVIEKNLKYLTENHKEIYDAYEKFGGLIHKEGGPIDEKNRWLIKIALSTSSQYEYALRTHILKALKSGCTKEEVEHAILLVAPTCGFPKMMQGLLVLREIIDKEE